MAADAFASSPEIWKPVVGCEDGYDVSSWGRVRTRARNWPSPRLLRPAVGPRGYVLVSLRGKTRKVHHLVLEAFDRAARTGEECAHLDGNPSNNRRENLRWKTSKENKEDQRRHGTMLIGERAVGAKLKDDEVREIRRLRLAGKQWKEIHRAYPHVSHSSVVQAGTGVSFVHVTDVPPVAGRLRYGQPRLPPAR